MGFKTVWMFATYLLWGSICYTGVNIPYGSMASAITNNPDERTQLSSWRNIGATLASMCIGVVLPLVVYYTDANGNTVLSPTRMSMAAACCSIAAIICYIICTSLSTERVKIEAKTEKFSLSQLLKQLFSSRALLTIILAAIVLLLSQLTMTGMNNYIFPNYFNNRTGASMASFTGNAVSIVFAMFIIPPLVKKFGKKETAIGGTVVSVIAFFTMYFSRISNMYLYVVFYGFGYFAIAFFNTVIWAMITDVIDEDELRNGTRSDGAIYSLYSFARKIGQALSSGLTGGLLTMIGYTKDTAFQPEVLNGIYTIATLIPAIGFTLLILVLLFLYPLKKSIVDANSAELARRRAARK